MTKKDFPYHMLDDIQYMEQKILARDYYEHLTGEKYVEE